MPGPESGEKQQKLHIDREIHDMMSILTRRLSHLQKKPEGGSASNIHDHDQEDDYGGFGIITMAGSNEGATMKDEMSTEDQHNQQLPPPLTTYLNNNFQGVNNSMTLDGSYSANDPGIHLDVDDYYQQPTRHKHGKNGKKKIQSESS